MREYTQYTAQMTKTHSHIRTTTNYVYISAKRSRMEPKRQQQGEMTHEKKTPSNETCITILALAVMPVSPNAAIHQHNAKRSISQYSKIARVCTKERNTHARTPSHNKTNVMRPNRTK